jgi:hypothetical protein
MLKVSGYDRRDGCGYGVELRGADNWRTARSLVKLQLGWIEGGRPNGSDLPGLFFANREGVNVAAERADDD